ncbi:S-adenosyl-L-methionine-dependent methyltransferase [Geopyxis carbonaria]|nr:S-adenosyl-L-methionine-dependent methyltransferase [Geopyxis carbonaria]
MAQERSTTTANFTVETAPIEVEDSDSQYGESLASDTTSISSSVVDYVYENGRRYHRFQEGKYFLPNDEQEQDRLDLFHHVLLLCLRGKLHLAPLDKPQKILDLGTGTGIWALDMAETYPEAEVTGTDLSPIQPGWVFPNCKFEVDDAEMDWMFPKDSFDFIHSRCLAQSIRNWPRYLRQMFEHTKPGTGYVQIVETPSQLHSDDNSLPADSILLKYLNSFNSACEKAGLRVLLTDSDADIVADLKAAGFVDIHVTKAKCPWAPWPKDKHMKEVGRSMQVQTRQAIPAYGTALMTRHLGMSAEEAKQLCDAAVGVVAEKKVHCYMFIIYVTARRPGPDEVPQ